METFGCVFNISTIVIGLVWRLMRITLPMLPCDSCLSRHLGQCTRRITHVNLYQDIIIAKMDLLKLKTKYDDTKICIS